MKSTVRIKVVLDLQVPSDIHAFVKDADYRYLIPSDAIENMMMPDARTPVAFRHFVAGNADPRIFGERAHFVVQG